MKNIAIYPGTFDPITYGHIDVIKRSLKIVNKLIVAVSNDYSKEYLFSAEERVLLTKKSLFKDLNYKKNLIKVINFKTLTTSVCRKYKASAIFRGLRAVSDFEYEFQMTGMNYQLNPDIETIFLMTSEKNSFISSNFVKEVHKLGGDVSNFVSKNTLEQLNKKNS